MNGTRDGAQPAEARHQRAGELVWRLWQHGDVTSDLPADLKPHTRAQGYAIQAEFDRLSETPRAGWKIAATSAGGQKHIAVDGPIAGRIFAARVLSSGSTTSIASNRMRVVEPEFAFRLGRTLAPRPAQSYSVAEVMSSVDTLHLALELPDSRFSDFTAVGGPTLIADNACAHELVVGPAVPAAWRGLDLAQHAVVARISEKLTREGLGANVLGDPRVALTWLVNELAGLGLALNASEFVTTGTCMTPVSVVAGDHVTADFGALGSISINIA